jgi:hypothetical protein
VHSIVQFYYITVEKPFNIMYLTNRSRQTLYLFIENNKEMTKKALSSNNVSNKNKQEILLFSLPSLREIVIGYEE